MNKLKIKEKIIIIVIIINCLLVISSLLWVETHEADALEDLKITSSDVGHFIIANEDLADYKYIPNSEIPQLDVSLIESANSRMSEEMQVEHLYNYLYRQNPSVFSREIVRIIVQESNRFGADYRLVAAIMGKESGFCRANYKTYNCFGYLNNTQYSSYENAFINLTPKIAAIVGRHGWNTMGIANEYRPVDRAGWASKVYAIASKI